MAIIKSADLVSFVIGAKNDGWGYVYSAQGETYTKKLAEQWGLANRANKGYDYFVNGCARWFGKRVADCSGLVIEAFRSQIPNYGDKSSSTLFNRCVQTGGISTIPETPGLCVWRNGHIGIYIGNGNVIEAGGTNVGVVQTALYSTATSTKWTHWGIMADVDYSEADTPSETDPDASFWLGRYLKLTHPYMRGDDVLQVQTALLSAGFSPGKLDGIYGPKTKNTVMRFQKSVALTVDGIVGKNTTAALNGKWVTGSASDQDPPLNSIRLGRLLKIASPYMKGDDVRDVQKALKQKGYSPGSIDGIYGKKTKGAVYKFQKAKNLKADGIVGKNTITALGGVWTG